MPISRGDLLRSILCDVLVVSGAIVFIAGLYLAWKPLALISSGLLLYKAAFILRGRIR